METLGWRLSQTGEGRSDFSVAEAEGIGRLSPEKANYQCLVLGLCPNLGPTGGCRKDWSLVCVCACVCVCARVCARAHPVIRSWCVQLFVTPWTVTSVHGIFQASILEWVAISFSRGSSQQRDQLFKSPVFSGRLCITGPLGKPLELGRAWEGAPT